MTFRKQTLSWITLSSALLGLASCQSPGTAVRPQPGSVHINPQYRVDHPALLNQYHRLERLSSDHWKSATHPEIGLYPPVSKSLRIGGDALSALEIDASGRVVRSELISGPAPLGEFIESFGRQVHFSIAPADRPGPWSFLLAWRFDPAGYIGVAPLGEKVILKPVN